MAANRNRTAGHNFEREIVKELKGLGYDEVVTSRAESRNMDNAGVDIFGKGFPYYIQCKNSKTWQDIHGLITSEKLPTDKPTLVFQKKTKKVGERFLKEGDYVSMKKEDFYEMLAKLKKYEDT